MGVSSSAGQTQCKPPCTARSHFLLDSTMLHGLKGKSCLSGSSCGRTAASAGPLWLLLSAAWEQCHLLWHPSSQEQTGRRTGAGQRLASGSPSSHDGLWMRQKCMKAQNTQIKECLRSSRLRSLWKLRHWSSFWPGSDPGLGVHFQTSTPAAVFLWSGWEAASLRAQLLCQSSDVIRLKSAAATNELDSSVVGLSGILVHVPAGQDPGLQTWGQQPLLIYISPADCACAWNQSLNGPYQKEILADRWIPDSCSRGCGRPGAAPCSEPWARPSRLPPSSSWQLPRRSWGQSGSWLQRSGHLKRDVQCLGIMGPVSLRLICCCVD